jgi:hypothetical protein
MVVLGSNLANLGGLVADVFAIYVIVHFVRDIPPYPLD